MPGREVRGACAAAPSRRVGHNAWGVEALAMSECQWLGSWSIVPHDDSNVVAPKRAAAESSYSGGFTIFDLLCTLQWRCGGTHAATVCGWKPQQPVLAAGSRNYGALLHLELEPGLGVGVLGGIGIPVDDNALVDGLLEAIP